MTRDSSSNRVLRRLAWHGFAILLLVFGLSHLRLGPLWTLERDPFLFFIALGGAYGLCALATTPFVRRGASRRWMAASLAESAVLAVFLLFLILADLTFPRSALLVGLGAGFVLLVLPVLLPRGLEAVGSGVLACLATAAIAIGLARTDDLAEVTSRAVGSTHYQLLVTAYPDVLGIPEASGGGVTAWGSEVLAATSEGALHLFRLPEDGAALRFEPGIRRVPFNRDEFLEDLAGRTDVSFRWFRVADVLVREGPDAATLLVSHHHWNRAERCVTLRVARAMGTPRHFEDDEELDWTTLFESTPCLPLKEQGHPFAGNQAGGRMALLDENTLLLTVGDHEWDGVNSTQAYSQDLSVSYGKVFAIDLRTGSTTLFSLGHRNPQGLVVASDGRIWETEHGPQGGDELILLNAGGNYGWPLTTYGVHYGTTSWPLDTRQGRHAGFEPPVYSWLPSIGVSSLTEIQGGLFDRWNGDLLVSSLKDHSLWRIRLDGDRVRFAERIALSARIRDLTQVPDGRLVLLTEEEYEGRGRSSIVVVEPAATEGEGTGSGPIGVERGELVFVTRCVGCHARADASTSTLGPNLGGIVGRPVAGDPGFRYSAALQERGGSWTEERLDAFLANPAGVVPGTSMQTEGIPTAEDRSALIRFLAGDG